MTTVRARLRRVPAWLCAPAVGLLAWRLEPHAYPSYDYAFAMSAAQDLLHGRATGYEVPVFSPVPHPLTLLVSLAVVPLGELAFPLFTALVLLAFGLLCWAVFRVGAQLSGPAVGGLAAIAVFTSPAIFELGVRTYGDVVFAALVLTALALELERPRRGAGVMVLLVAAGLLRPEAWGLAAVYWLWLAPARSRRERAGLAALALVAPLAWMAMDAILTGDPLHSVRHTEGYTARAGRILDAGTIWQALDALLNRPVLLGAAAGAGLLLWRLGRRALVPLSAGILTFVLTVGPAVVGQTPVLRRYLIVPAAVLAVLFAVACLGWTRLDRGPVKAAWALGGVALLLATLLAIVPDRRYDWRADRAQQAERVEALQELRAWAASRSLQVVARDPACRPLRTPGYSFRPYLRLWLDVPATDVAFDLDDAAPREPAVLLPTADDDYQRAMLSTLGRDTRAAVFADARQRRRLRLIGASPEWDLYASARCRQGARTLSAGLPGG